MLRAADDSQPGDDAHRSCLADRLDPHFDGDRARVDAVGRNRPSP
jgi:hypothetical protein